MFILKDSETNPNTTASSIAGDAVHVDGRKRRIEATQLRKSVFGRKHNRLDESKVRLPANIAGAGSESVTHRKMTLYEDSATS